MTTVQTELSHRTGAVQTDGLLQVPRLTMKQPEHADTNVIRPILGKTAAA